MMGTARLRQTRNRCGRALRIAPCIVHGSACQRDCPCPCTRTTAPRQCRIASAVIIEDAPIAIGLKSHTRARTRGGRRGRAIRFARQLVAHKRRAGGNELGHDACAITPMPPPALQLPIASFHMCRSFHSDCGPRAWWRGVQPQGYVFPPRGGWWHMRSRRVASRCFRALQHTLAGRVRPRTHARGPAPWSE